MTASEPSGRTPALPVLHLDFLDGLRGLSALYVLLHHAYLMLLYGGIADHGGLAAKLMAPLRPLSFGRYAVDLFIVLSGYCLMLPVLRSGGSLRGGFGSYLRRRARRILPPYYAALIFSLGVLVLLRSAEQSAGLAHPETSDWPSPGNLLSHFLLLHNLSNPWSHTINAPLWSVATEWQIYFVFPLGLLPVWQKWGLRAAVAVGFGVGWALDLIVPGGLGGAAPWFIGLFALGMAGAALGTPGESAEKSGRFWGWLSLVLGVALAVVGTIVRGWFQKHAALVDPVFGVAAMALLIYCARAFKGAEQAPAVLRFLRHPWLVTAGAFSYSLYLTHYPLLHLAELRLRQTQPALALWVILTFALYVPAALCFSYLFHLVFERPFMPGSPRTVRAANAAAELSPAP